MDARSNLQRKQQQQQQQHHIFWEAIVHIGTLFFQAQEIFRQEHLWSAHEEAVNQCREQNLVQGAYFLQRDLMFLRDQEPVLRKELGKGTLLIGTRHLLFDFLAEYVASGRFCNSH